MTYNKLMKSVFAIVDKLGVDKKMFIHQTNTCSFGLVLAVLAGNCWIGKLEENEDTVILREYLIELGKKGTYTFEKDSEEIN